MGSLVASNEIAKIKNDRYDFNNAGSGSLLRYANRRFIDEKGKIRSPTENIMKKLSYKYPFHSDRVSYVLEAMRREKFHCDVILETDGGSDIIAHKVVIAACCPYFYTMLKNFRESDQQRIKIQGIDHSALETLVDYFYSGEICIDEMNVQNLLPAANLLLLNEIRDSCCDFLITQLHPSNCLGIRSFIDIYGSPNFITHVDHYIQQRFWEVIEEEEFLLSAPQQVAELICSDGIVVSCEEMVFESVISWICADFKVRQNFIIPLLKCVRLPMVFRNAFVKRLEEEPLFSQSFQRKIFLKEIFSDDLMSVVRKTLLSNPRGQARQTTDSPKVLLLVGTNKGREENGNIECFDFETRKWYQSTETMTGRYGAGLLVFEEQIYLIGGYSGFCPLKTTDVYDQFSAQWLSFAKMNNCRMSLGVTVLNNLIYAVGGYDGAVGLNSAEVYNPWNNEWAMISPMAKRRNEVGVGVVDGLLYAVGGYDSKSKQYLRSVECYNPATNEWTFIADMIVRRKGAGVGVFDGILYVFGGYNGLAFLKSAEAYNPKTNTWSLIHDMAYRRCNAGVVVLDGLIYVLGAGSNSVEAYSPTTNTWRTLCGRSSYTRKYNNLVAVNKIHAPPV